MKQTCKRLTLLAAAAVSVLAIAACTKETPFKHEYKENVLSNKAIDTESSFLYVSSYENTTRVATHARPYWMGGEKLVRFKFTETSLQVIEDENDPRFRGNSANQRLVLEIPVEHLAYRCREDRFGECQNQEEKNNEINWKQKDRFKPDFASLKEGQPQFLPIELQAYFGQSCYQPLKTELLDYELTETALNIRLEKTYMVKAECLNDDVSSISELMSNSSVKVVNHHSFVKLDSVASKDYQAVSYPNKDSDSFGFFTTEDGTLDADFSRLENNRSVYMNRFNPKRGTVVYYLSPEFNKPENRAIKASTHFAFDKINQGLADAGAPLRLKLEDPKEGVYPGDIRYNNIVLVENPTGMGLLGYGPSVANPLTGEIISARTVMYSGNLAMTVRNQYEIMRRERQAKKAQASQANASTPPGASTARLIGRMDKALKKQAVPASSNRGRSRTAHSHVHSSLVDASPASSNRLLEMQKAVSELQINTEAMKPLDRLKLQESKEDNGLFSFKEDARTRYLMSRNCFYTEEMASVETALRDGFEKLFPGPIKPWTDLSQKERQEIIDLALPTIWVPILLHEVGHNLGLRHNFAGSEDASNWWSNEELQKMGVNRPIQGSTIMDYGFDYFQELPTLGKYDIAALRFGYARKVEVKDKDGFKLVDVPSSLEELTKESDLALRDYRYCTDEHVGANPNCAQSDAGTNLVDMALHWMEKFYQANYERTNFRNGRMSFSLMDDPSYAARLRYIFMNLRLIYERYENISFRFDLAPDAPEWEEEPSLKDLKIATMLTGLFFVDVMSEPDSTCHILNNETGKVMAGPLAEINPAALDCSEVKFKEQFTYLAQTGRSFKSKKAPNSTNSYADQIDLRGIWIDKLIAANMLFARELKSPIFDRYTMSYAQIPGLTEVIQKAIDDILMDVVAFDVALTLPDGKKVTEKNVYRNVTTSADSNLLIPTAMNPELSRMLGLPRSNTTYSAELMRTMVRLVSNDVDHVRSSIWNARYQVYTSAPNDGRPLSEYAAADFGGKRYLATPENVIAYRLITILSNMGRLNQMLEALKVLSPKAMMLVVNLKKEGKTEIPADAALSEDEKPKVEAALKIDLPYSVLEARLNGVLRPFNYYLSVLQSLPVAN